MAKEALRYVDNSGIAHETPEGAALGDIAVALGRLSADGGIAGGVAKLVLEKRSEIEAAFADLDRLKGVAR